MSDNVTRAGSCGVYFEDNNERITSSGTGFLRKSTLDTSGYCEQLKISMRTREPARDTTGALAGGNRETEVSAHILL